MHYEAVVFLFRQALQKYHTIQMFSNDKVDVMYICLSSSLKCDGTPGKLVSENIRLLAASKATKRWTLILFVPRTHQNQS